MYYNDLPAAGRFVICYFPIFILKWKSGIYFKGLQSTIAIGKEHKNWDYNFSLRTRPLVPSDSMQPEHLVVQVLYATGNRGRTDKTMAV